MSTETTTNFGYEDLVISRTDERGVILSANEMFRQISGYDWKELKGAPQKILRHGDMPKAVFYLLWEHLKAGKAVGGFIKNRTKSGRHYWVYAVLGPLDDGYLSIRIRPSDASITGIASIYQKLVDMEQEDDDLTPAKSADRFLDLLKDEGYPSYSAFMSRMLTKQIKHRCEMTDISQTKNAAGFEKIFEQWNSVHDSCRTISKAYKAIKLIPLNMQVQAAHLTDRGLPLSVISSNFASLAKTINRGLENFSAAADDVTDALNSSVFLSCTEVLMDEAVEELRKATDENMDESEANLMSLQAERYRKKAVEEKRYVTDNIGDFVNMTGHIKRELSALSVTQVMCSIENAQIHGTLGDSIESIINELRSFQGLSDGEILSIGTQLNSVRHHLDRLAS